MNGLAIKKKIRIKCQNGISFDDFKKEVFDISGLDDFFDFEESDQPNFIIFGPYGNDIPSKSSNYIRIGYFCENIVPDLSCCEWAFGIPREEEIKNERYKRIQWHGVNPNQLIKNFTENDIDRIISTKNKFCNFLYSNQVPYREEFFKQLSKYKKVDAPGKSMNNMTSIDTLYKGDYWERKRQFIGQYKFTIAFENYSYPGYQTEKLYDSMLYNSLPIYCGDLCVHKIFNTKSFLNTPDYVDLTYNGVIKALEKKSQQNFTDSRPSFHKSIYNRARRKIKLTGRLLKMKIQYSNLDFSPLIDRIIEIDSDSDLHAEYLRQPWLINNHTDEGLLNKGRWINIFNSI